MKYIITGMLLIYALTYYSYILTQEGTLIIFYIGFCSCGIIYEIKNSFNLLKENECLKKDKALWKAQADSLKKQIRFQSDVIITLQEKVKYNEQ